MYGASTGTANDPGQHEAKRDGMQKGRKGERERESKRNGATKWLPRLKVVKTVGNVSGKVLVDPKQQTKNKRRERGREEVFEKRRLASWLIDMRFI